MPLALIARSLDVLALISILWYTRKVLSRLSTRASGFCSSVARVSYPTGKLLMDDISAAYANLSSCFSRASDIIHSRKMLKRVVIEEVLARLAFLNLSSLLLFIRLHFVALSKSCSVVQTRFALILYFRMVAHQVACHSLSKFVLKSISRLLINSLFGVFYSYFWAGDSCFSKNLFKFTLWDSYFF